MSATVQHFTFQRIRPGEDPMAFRPDGTGGATLTLRSLNDDTLSLGSVRAGILQTGDTVTVSRGSDIIFRGTVEERIWHGWRGASLEESVTVCGPWRRLARIPLTQLWHTMVEREDPETGQPTQTLEFVPSSRAILNQREDGAALSVRGQVLEILQAAARAGVIAEPAAADIAAIPADLMLPFDEGRDLTLAQALARELRYTPHLATRFDYSVNPPRLAIVEPGAGNAAWIAEAAADGAVLDIKETQAGLPPLGCILEITETGSIDGNSYAAIRAQEAGDTSDPERTLRAVLPVAGVDSSKVPRKLDLKTADIPGNLNDAGFWKRWHRDLASAPASLEITGAKRSGGMGNYPRFVITSGIGLAELEEAGIGRFAVETLSCTAKITTTASVEGETYTTVETAALTLEIIATTAKTKTYKWIPQRDYTGPEYVPSGLAAELLAAHQADGASADITIALAAGAALPLPGDTRASLTAHTVTIDLRALTATVSFGPPAALGPADLAGFLSAFRNLRRASLHTQRPTGEAGGEDETDNTLQYLPSTSSGFSKTGCSKLEIGDGTSKTSINPDDIQPGDIAKFRKIAYTAPDGSEIRTRILSTEQVSPDEDDDAPLDPVKKESDDCSHDGPPDGGGGGGGGPPGNEHDGGHPGGEEPDRDGGHPGKTGPCW
ncbi:MAG: hypothetical protein PHG74_09330 [Kiritimatiellae bacterium]|nr:hypothetical protein [Kiritimatiellia bacterium]MDD3584204.1 hypothetical protein [Kiritimatiellia bacterium]